VKTLNRAKIRYVPLDVATATPGGGFWEVIADSWWAHEPGKGLLFYSQSPQCNKNEQIARAIQKKCHPQAETVFVARVYVRHDCGDYI
jgi:hypothetical protein